MAADDVAADADPRRARASRLQFLNELPSKYRVALVTFGNKVQLLVAPTFDREP